jgi:Uncharacterised protein family (UPF0164)
MLKRTLLFFIFLYTLHSILLTCSYADTGQAGLDIAVLEAGVGARALGMGGAFTAVADNADAPFWNPAGLAQINKNEITAMQTKLSTDADHYYVSYVTPLLGGGFGISWIQVGMSSITQTGSSTGEYNEVTNLGIFSYFSNAYLLAYGRNITDNLSFGITAKYLTSDMPGLVSVEGASAYGYSVTPGLLYKPTNNLSIGFKIDELINYQKWGTDTEEIVPSKYRLGIAFGTRVPLIGNPLLLSGDVSQINKAGYVPEGSAGAEAKFGQIAFRIGYSEQSMTGGAGFEADHISIDYAYVTQTSLTKDNVHRVSLTGMW